MSNPCGKIITPLLIKYKKLATAYVNLKRDSNDMYKRLLKKYIKLQRELDNNNNNNNNNNLRRYIKKKKYYY